MTIDQSIRKVLCRDQEEHKLPSDVVASRVAAIIASAKNKPATGPKGSSK